MVDSMIADILGPTSTDAEFSQEQIRYRSTKSLSAYPRERGHTS